jgi:WD40 repeat protein
LALTACADGQVRFWDVATGRANGAPLLHDSEARAITLSRDGRFLLTGTSASTLYLWNVATRAAVVTPFRQPSETAINAVAFSPNGRRFLVGSEDGTTQMWLWDDEAKPPVPGPTYRQQARVNAVSFSPGGQLVLTASGDKTARLWESETGRPTGVLLQYHHAVLSAVFSPDGQTILTGGNDGAQLWQAATGKPLGAAIRHSDIDLRIKNTGQPFQRLMSNHRNQDSISAVAFSPDGKKLLVGSWFMRASVWTVPAGLPAQMDKEQVVRWVQVLTGMKLEASGSVHVLDAETWSEAHQRLK